LFGERQRRRRKIIWIY